MGQDLVEIQPRELKFTFELKKQSSCSIQLSNNPMNMLHSRIILPRSTCDFTVTMQAQRTAPPDMQLKDKFLVQCTVVPYGSKDEDIVPAFFSKETGRYIEESKLRVVLLSPPHSPVLQPINGALNQEPAFEVPVLKETPVVKETPAIETQETQTRETPIIPEEIPTVFKTKFCSLSKVENFYLSHVTEDVQNMKAKLNNLESKLDEAEQMIFRLREENKSTIQERG
uniref:MSP domain-containing protein n=1 Tax=Ananas comosus var. bracteatus TaxID=296719 RepID=A0A6V7PC19_ANACO|nr:unnamed protein product [Ananas comosus var. bracteatus]